MIETGPHVPATWRRSAARVLRENWRRVLVVGETDRGKSTYCRFLAKTLLHEGRTVSFVDADIGQKDVGPPATVTLSDLKLPADSSMLACNAMYFVGHVNPSAHLLPLVVGTRRMTEVAKGEFVVIDTTGLIQGKGRMLKGFQIDSLRPDVLVCLEQGDELAPIRHAARHCNIMRLRPSGHATPKSTIFRRRARESAFFTHFQGAREFEIRLDKLMVQRSSLFNGEPFADPRFLYSERLPDGVIAIEKEAGSPDLEGVQLLPRHFADHLLCGIADAAGECLGLGIIEKIDFRRGTLTLYTPLPKSRIRIVQLGDLYLDQSGRELRQGRLAHF